MMLDPIDAYEEAAAASDAALPGSTARKLIDFMTEWAALSGRRDTPALDLLLPDDLILTMFDGRVLTKAEYLASLGALPADFRLTDYDQTTQIFADSAIVRAACRFEIEGAEMRLRYTATFIRRDDRWDVVAFHNCAV